MPIPRTYRAEAIVLKGMDLGEADRIVTLYTRYFGKLRAIAKGARRPTSRLAGHVEPLAHATFQLAKGRELDVITQAETRETYRGLRETLVETAAGWYVAELVDRFTVDRVPSTPTFDLLATALRHLNRGQPAGFVCRWFDLHLLDRAGFRPELFRCVQCAVPLEERDHVFSPAAGGVLCARCRAEAEGVVAVITVRALKSLRYLLRSEFAEAARLRIDASLSLELERHLRAFLQTVLDRDVNAARLLDDVRGLQSAGA
ncbi:MAG: DNA repair protein RecO [Chloroflexi bacterium]|nr:MAG: DNA repair protein RecO [Chloroflexota bacterium]